MKELIFIIVIILLFIVDRNHYLLEDIKNDIQVEKVETQRSDVQEVTVTMYNSVTSQCDADPLITAGMYHIPNPYTASDLKWVALSRDLLKRWGGPYDYGDEIYLIAGDKTGKYIVTDCMNARFKNRVDILESVGSKLYKHTGIIVKHERIESGTGERVVQHSQTSRTLSSK